ncbi:MULTISPECIES: hypothetical protein [unclassified Rhizobium]|jgi:hypothetical protein|uniref:hypothetical protein n=1 Tax=unclassified Rhizobium TaxID=2613769 RepID=UPI0021E7B28F|nr:MULTISPECIES: hypothetical protein [unclassified Rhizobium]MCV3766156.1 hypothetical protein [Rhizobium sp. TRM95796]MDH6269534.1 K+-sensing histidine kinase KdpD [Rhizobium sp. SG_E_25_P2]
MILTTSTLTGLFSALLRSAVAVILVAFLISVVAIAGVVVYGASIFTALLVVAGFNLGLIAAALGYVLFGGGTRRA